MAVIHLAKAGVLEEIAEVFGGAVIPKAVEVEVVEGGRRAGKPDAELVALFVNNETLKIIEIERGELYETLYGLGLGAGELEALLLCIRNKEWLLVSNDRATRRVAPVFNVKLATVPQAITAAAINGGLSKQRAREAITQLKRIGWYSNEVIELALQTLEEK